MVGMGRTFVERWPSPPKMRHQLVPEHHHDRTGLPLIMPSGLPPQITRDDTTAENKHGREKEPARDGAISVLGLFLTPRVV